MHGASHCPSVGLWGIYCCLLSWPCSKEKSKKLCRFSKMNFQGWKIFKGFSIDRLSRMTLILDNSLFSQKENFLRMRSHECLYFLFWFETQSIKHFFLLFYFTCRLRHPHQTYITWNFWLNRLGNQLRSTGHLSKQTNDLHSHSSES